MFRFLSVVPGALLLAACNTTPAPYMNPNAIPPSAYTTPGVTPAGFRLPEGSGCAVSVARWRAIQDNDLKSGHVSAPVHKQIGGEIAQAEAACSAGRDAEAQSMIVASRKRHGYP